MGWIIPASALLLIAAVAGTARYLRRRRVLSSDNLEMITTGEPRVRQFLRTGSHRMPEPDTGPGDLRREARTQLEEKEAVADLTTLNAFLADVRDSLGADEAVF